MGLDLTAGETEMARPYVKVLSEDDLLNQLTVYEIRYRCDSIDFYRAILNGERTCNVPDFIRWAGLCCIALRQGIITIEGVDRG